MRITIEMDDQASQPRITTSGSGLAVAAAAQDAGAARGEPATPRFRAAQAIDAGAAREAIEKKRVEGWPTPRGHQTGTGRVVGPGVQSFSDRECHGVH